MDHQQPWAGTGTPKVTRFKFTSGDSAKTAVLMARLCQEREDSHPGVPQGTPTSEYQRGWDEHRAFATSSVVASVMFLEANINEVFLTAGMSLGGPTGSGTMSSFQLVGGLLDHDDRKRLDGTWQLADRASLLERYQFVLGLLGKEPMDQGAAPFQPVRDLGDVRNRLIHFKEGPNEVGSEPRKFEKTLHRLLGGKGFKAHPYTTAQNQFFPDQFFGYAGCRWAWETADAFAQEFHRRLGVEPAYQIFRSDLTLD